ncbi:hypothetical protein [Mesorhizobium sp. ES1-1]|uniref:hypothetical protein n=1 Tax=Mesorhizobium sp. ES1-1 TaxID=2876629 RepID=UPI001CCC826D|nr:hypothetical protein [Mesorhizobium sp. ES1-1]MBZ9675715.1 hypothetical protein [Mesorhizobium sp. ES1-1]
MGKGLIFAVILALSSTSGCVSARGGFCTISSPLRLSAATVDTLSNAEVKALLAHNRKGERLCGWKP